MSNRDRILVIAAMHEELAAFPEIPGVETRVCGVGKVNAAIAAARAHADGFPAVLIVGTAGAVDPRLNIGDVVVAALTLHHDVDVTALGFSLGEIPFARTSVWASDDQLRALTECVCEELGIKSKNGIIVSGDRFVADRDEVKRIHSVFKASCLDMETAGLAQACESFNLPWLAIRVISDKADGSAHVDFPSFLPKASEKLARIVRQVAEEWLALRPVDPFADTLPPFSSLDLPGCLEEEPLPDPFDFQSCLLDNDPTLDLTES